MDVDAETLDRMRKLSKKLYESDTSNEEEDCSEVVRLDKPNLISLLPPDEDMLLVSAEGE